MRVEEWDIKRLKPWEDNPRDIEPGELNRLRGQLEKWGQNQLLMVTEDGTILGGNQRYKAFKQMGVDKVWVSVVSPKDKQEMVELALGHNDEAGFTLKDKLMGLLADLPDIDLELYKVHLGFSTALSELDKVNLETNIHTPNLEPHGGSDLKISDDVKKIIFKFSPNVYEKVISRLDELMMDAGLGTHAELFLHLLDIDSEG